MMLALPILMTIAHATSPSVSVHPFGTAHGQKAHLYTITNHHGMSFSVTDYGGTITSIMVPDRDGKFADVALGFDSANAYIDSKSGAYFGCTVGRYANRIAKGHLVVDGKTYRLAVNNGVNSLHGGKQGFDKRMWTAHEVPSGVEMSYTSKDGEEHYPGRLSVRVRFTLSEDNAIKIEYWANANKDTVCNLTNHTYFNLAGAGDPTILNHLLTIHADRYTPIDATSIPLGPLAKVEGTPFDFRSTHAIGERIEDSNEQLQNGQGYDHNFVLNHPMGKLGIAAEAYEPDSGRTLKAFTTEPGVQLYTGNFLSDVPGKDGQTYYRRSAFCLEAQHFPDSPNHPAYPSTLLKVGHTYRQTTVYQFGVNR